MEWREMIYTIMEDGIDVTAWEQEFLEDLLERAEEDEDWEPTERQMEIIERIYDERV